MHPRAKMLEASSEQRDRISVIRSSFSKKFPTNICFSRR